MSGLTDRDEPVLSITIFIACDFLRASQLLGQLKTVIFRKLAPTMKLPFHAVEVRGDILLAARGVSIHSFNLTDGSHIACSWKFPAAAEVNQNVALSKEEEEGDHPVTKQEDQGGPPAKRVKLDDGGEAPGEQPATTTTTGEGRQEAKADKTPSHRGGGSGDRVRGGGKKNKKQGGGPQPGPLSQPTERSMVILMTTTQDGQHVVAVTSDKSIWVLAHDGQGQLEQLSRRYVAILEYMYPGGEKHLHKTTVIRPDRQTA